jgi:anti-sigma-K factor RskA
VNAAHEHERYAEDVGAYLLGALDSGEERGFENHLDSCPVCQEEIDRLTVAVAALPASVDQFAPPEELKASLMEAVRAEAVNQREQQPARRPSRRRAWRGTLFARPAFAGGLAAALLAVGIAVGVLIGGSGDSSGGFSERAASVDAGRLASGAKATLIVPENAGRDGGAMLRVSGMPLPVDRDVYEVWARRGDKVAPVSLFEVSRDGNGTAAIPDKLDGVDEIMVTRERRGGSDVPTEKPVVAIKL